MEETPKKRTRNVSVSNTDIAWIKKQLTDQGELLTKLHSTVIGDKIYGHEGLVEKVNRHDRYIDSQDKLKAKFMGGAMVIGAGWTLLLKFWDKIF